MWVCLNNAFLSIVADKTDSSKLLVRARVEGDIEQVFPVCAVEFTPVNHDYLYRASIPREVVASRLAALAEDISYTNFKDSVRENWRHNAYMRIWNIMYQAQETLRRRARE
jgi:hypothetical protein